MSSLTRFIEWHGKEREEEGMLPRLQRQRALLGLAGSSGSAVLKRPEFDLQKGGLLELPSCQAEASARLCSRQTSSYCWTGQRKAKAEGV